MISRIPLDCKALKRNTLRNNNSLKKNVLGSGKFLFKPQEITQKRLPICKNVSIKVSKFKNILKHLTLKTNSQFFRQGNFIKSFGPRGILSEIVPAQYLLPFDQIWDRDEQIHQTCKVVKTFYRYRTNRFL